MSPRQKKREFTRDFKDQAAQMVLTGELNRMAVAKKYNVGTSLITKWIREYEKTHPKSVPHQQIINIDKVTPPQPHEQPKPVDVDKIENLEREIRWLRHQIDFYRKELKLN